MCEGPHAYIPVENTYKVVVEMTWNGELVMNVYNVTSDDAGGSVFRQAVVDLFHAWWTTTIKPIVSNQLRLNRIVVTDLSSESGGVTEEPGLAGDVGNSNVESCSNNQALVISWITEQRGKSFRGRTYHVGMTVDQLEVNDVYPAQVAGITTAYRNLLESVPSLSAVAFMSVVSYCHNSAWRSDGVATEITDLRVGSRVDTQRRRLPRRA